MKVNHEFVDRIDFLSQMRNKVMKTMFERKEKFEKIFFMNDIFFCYEDVLKLLSVEEVDLISGIDILEIESYFLGWKKKRAHILYDTWVARDLFFFFKFLFKHSYSPQFSSHKEKDQGQIAFTHSSMKKTR